MEQSRQGRPRLCPAPGFEAPEDRSFIPCRTPRPPCDNRGWDSSWPYDRPGGTDWNKVTAQGFSPDVLHDPPDASSDRGQCPRLNFVHRVVAQPNKSFPDFQPLDCLYLLLPLLIKRHVRGMTSLFGVFVLDHVFTSIGLTAPITRAEYSASIRPDLRIISIPTFCSAPLSRSLACV